MSSLTNSKLRRMIMQELAKMVGEDALVAPGGRDSYRDTGYRPQARAPHNLNLTKHSDSYDDFGGGEEGTCEQCGGMTYEDQCLEVGCGGMSKRSKMLQEGGCGCGSSDDGSDYSIDSMMHVDMHSHDDDVHKYAHNNYMAKPALYKVAKYAKKLFK